MKEYKNKDIVVYWYPERCAHPGTCLRTLPEVFCLNNRPWINVDAASPEKIIQCIDKCPSGALCYSIPEGSSVDSSFTLGAGALDNIKALSSVVKIKVVKNGPYLIEGPTEVFDTDDKPMFEGARLALCACGCSQNPPFCDGSHKRKH